MKKMIVFAILLITSLVFAVPAEPVRRMTTEQARTRVESSKIFKDIMKLKSEGKELSSDPAVMKIVVKVVDLTLKDAVTLSASENANILKLLGVSPQETMTEISRLSSIVKDPTSSPTEKTMAAKSLELMARSGHLIESLAIDSATAKKQQETVKSILEISNKIASLDFGVSSKSFVEKYEKALKEGKTIEDAVKIASNGKFTEKELRDCE